MAVNRNIRICYIADPESVHIRRWLDYFLDRGYRVSLISYNRVVGRLPDAIEVFDLTRLCSRKKIRYLVWFALVKKIIRKINPDIVHAHNIAGAGWLGLFSGFHPLIATAHGSDMLLIRDRSFLFQALNAAVLRRADYVTAGSWALYDRCVSFGAAPGATEYIMMGTNTRVFKKNRSVRQKERSSEKPAGPVVFFIRSMHEIYNPMQMLNAIPLIRKTFPDAEFWFLKGNGDKALMADHMQMTKQLGLAGCITYLEPAEKAAQMAYYYNAADICVSIPFSDGLSIAVLEAVACEIPVLMTDLASYRDLFLHGRHVIKIPVGDVNALSEAVIQLLKNKAQRKSMSTGALRKVGRSLDSKICMQRYEQIYQKMTAFGAQKNRSDL